ncbi:MAG: molybdopterin-guanine dinucleotide biosynthesis protein B [Hyphomicrobiaceae bacterium]|nr:molybdopterin-guanine dinucleotide biosynthesis protein B [Hyphomicrobiaceae bacterium]
MTAPPVIGIAGWKNSGKTTLTVRLIEEFTRRGLKVATIKHAHHDFQIDEGETDSARHRRAGATEVAIVSGGRWAMVHELRDEPEPSFSEMLARLSPVDLVIAEGYKREPIPKIELRRRESKSKETFAPGDRSVIAIATDHETEGHGLPVLALDDVAGIADVIAAHLKLAQQS